MVSRLWVLLMATRGLAPLSDWEELDEARGRRLQEEEERLGRIFCYQQSGDASGL